MKTFPQYFRIFTAISLIAITLVTLPLLSGCKSDKEKQIDEQRARAFAPRKEKVDPNAPSAEPQF